LKKGLVPEIVKTGDTSGLWAKQNHLERTDFMQQASWGGKILIASDIHGSALYCEKLLEAARREGALRILLLGDILYHGPRNDLPDGYAPKFVIGMLNEVRERLVCVRGNCEAEVDQMVLDFPVMAEMGLLLLGDRTLYFTHGHIHHKDNPPPLCRGDILLCGHTHVPALEVLPQFIYMNPGSVSIPKEGSPHGYMTMEGGLFQWKTLEGETYREFDIATVS
jgi:putative phosphoesterase